MGILYACILADGLASGEYIRDGGGGGDNALVVLGG